MIEAIHTSIKGRGRYKIDSLYRSPSLKQYLEQSLVEKKGIEEVTANPLTRNVLVKFKPEIPHEKIARYLEKSLASYQQQPQQRYRPKQRHPKPSGEGTETPKIEQWYLMDLGKVIDTLNTATETGLSTLVAEENLRKYGYNILSEIKTPSEISILAEQFQSLPVALLGGAALLSAFTGGLVDALVILAVMGTNIVIGFTTELQSENIIQSLKKFAEPSAYVLRDGQEREISALEVAIGDILLLKQDTSIVADARLIKAEKLRVNESALTGESIPVKKKPQTIEQQDIPLAERSNMVYKGTLITKGEGQAVVVATGRYTETGKIQSLVEETAVPETPLQKQLDEVTSQLVFLGTGVCGLVFCLGILRGYSFVHVLKTSISLAVASFPEGLPTIATTILALGIKDMQENHVLIRNLSAVEALGAVQSFCMDKTGTITENKMVVAEINTNLGEVKLKKGKFKRGQEIINPQEHESLMKFIQVCLLCNESEVTREEDGEYEVRGTATENALINLGFDADMTIIELREKQPIVRTIPRGEERNIMTTIHKADHQGYFVAVKGSPEEVLALCSQHQQEREVVSLTEVAKNAIALENEGMAGKALRVLGVAYNYINDLEGNLEQNLIWLGLVGMTDPIREGVEDLMEIFHEAGIAPVIITGDQSQTAYAIGKTLNLSRDQQLAVLESSDLLNVNSEEVTALADKVDVFARISPAEKLQIVQALQKAGKIVAMTGDGINDLPALKAANVGVAMGVTGSSLVSEVADVVLQKDNLETMIIAVSKGRTIYTNIRKAILFLLTTNISEIIVTMSSTLLGLGEPLTPMQLLWINLVTDTFPALALALEPPEPNVLKQPPRDPEAKILENSDFTRIVFESGVISTSALLAYLYGLIRYGIGAKASTIIFMSLTIAQILETLSCRSEQYTIFDWDQMPRNQYVEAAVIASVALQLFPIAVPGLRNLLDLTPIDPLDCLVIGGSAIAPLLINEGTKKMRLGSPEAMQA